MPPGPSDGSNRRRGVPNVETIVVRRGARTPSTPAPAGATPSPGVAPPPSSLPASSGALPISSSQPPSSAAPGSAPPSSSRPASRPRVYEAPAPPSSRPGDSRPDSSSRRPHRRGGASLPVTARNLAAEVVARVERDGAFAAAVLDHELKRSVQLSARDRALATELVYGTLRLRPLLEKSIEAVTPRGIQTLDARTRALLLVAAYQIHYTRIPAFAAVSEAVEAIRSVKGRTVAGFANGALRQLATVAQQTPLPRLPGAFRDATAPWLRRALERSIGEDATEALLTAGPYPPPLNLRVRAEAGASLPEARDRWIAKLREALPAASIESGKFAPGAIRVRGAGDPHAMPGYAEGAWSIQEEGSQLVGQLLGVRPGDRVLDACAGRGNKSTLLAEGLRDEAGVVVGSLDVADVKPEKLSRLAGEFGRLGLPASPTFGVDWSLGTGEIPLASYDRVLVDAPCSGTGTIRRRPELQTRRQIADIAELATLQARILAHAIDAVRPGGRLVYAVCSVLRDECEAVLATLLEARKDVAIAPFDAPIAAALFGDGATQGRLLTHLHGTDAYFVASLTRA